MRKLSNTLGVDDVPSDKHHRGDVGIIGIVGCGTRMDGLVHNKVRKDGRNATRVIRDLVLHTKFEPHVQLVLLQGITFAGFNVVDIHSLADDLQRPVMVVSRKQPNFKAIEHALRTRVKGGLRKWALIDKAGRPEPLEGVYVQRAGLTVDEARYALQNTRLHGALPEPIRLAHVIGAGWVLGESHGRA